MSSFDLFGSVHGRTMADLQLAQQMLPWGQPYPWQQLRGGEVKMGEIEGGVEIRMGDSHSDIM